MKVPIVTLTTDFGTKDAYVGSMKGALLRSLPTVTIVDLSHEIPPQDIGHAHFFLRDVVEEYPKGTIHLGVIDPGVGSTRRGLIIEWKGQILIGPDNGLFGFARVDDGARYWKIHDSLRVHRGGRTFDGRDFFVPAALKVIRDANRANYAESIPTIENLPHLRSLKEKGMVCGEVVYVDHFGNLITNIQRDEIGAETGNVFLDGVNVGLIRGTYSEVDVKDIVVLWNSSNYLEVAQRNGSALTTLSKGMGSKVQVQLKEKSS